MIGVGALLSLGLLTIQQAHSGQQGGPTTCSLGTLKGLYMFAQSGYQPVNGSLVPLGVTGKDVFHGNGAFDSLRRLASAASLYRTMPRPALTPSIRTAREQSLCT